jgi:hypothetical protein
VGRYGFVRLRELVIFGEFSFCSRYGVNPYGQAVPAGVSPIVFNHCRWHNGS